MVYGPGGQYGFDAAAHRGVLAAGVGTVTVLACGLEPGPSDVITSSVGQLPVVGSGVSVRPGPGRRWRSLAGPPHVERVLVDRG
jgi:hypothetical protein